ncbi:B12-binding domain-containing protein [Sutcliffiella horikoshii]|uniref:B12-binding domain-containing protein n=1 Tax=Sutcliffiella horikoshii TaxID=79883 RepID=UPI003CF4C065
MNEISKKLSQFLLEKNVASGWSCVKDTIDQGYNSAFIYDFILRDAMYRIGEMWEENKISVAHEHLATGTCELILTKYHLEKLNDRYIKENSPSLVPCFFV